MLSSSSRLIGVYVEVDNRKRARPDYIWLLMIIRTWDESWEIVKDLAINLRGYWQSK